MGCRGQARGVTEYPERVAAGAFPAYVDGARDARSDLLASRAETQAARQPAIPRGYHLEHRRGYGRPRSGFGAVGWQPDLTSCPNGANKWRWSVTIYRVQARLSGRPDSQPTGDSPDVATAAPRSLSNRCLTRSLRPSKKDRKELKFIGRPSRSFSRR